MHSVQVALDDEGGRFFVHGQFLVHPVHPRKSKRREVGSVSLQPKAEGVTAILCIILAEVAAEVLGAALGALVSATIAWRMGLSARPSP